MRAFYYNYGGFLVWKRKDAQQTNNINLSWNAAAAVLVTTNGVQNITSIPAPFTTGLKDWESKNWLFCDTPAGADASMKIYSMIETAKANELDPLKYLSFLLEHRPGAEMSDEELEQFAPWSKLAQETCK